MRAGARCQHRLARRIADNKLRARSGSPCPRGAQARHPSNCTMLYGHVETARDRAEHLSCCATSRTRRAASDYIPLADKRVVLAFTAGRYRVPGAESRDSVLPDADHRAAARCATITTLSFTTTTCFVVNAESRLGCLAHMDAALFVDAVTWRPLRRSESRRDVVRCRPAPAQRQHTFARLDIAGGRRACTWSS